MEGGGCSHSDIRRKVARDVSMGVTDLDKVCVCMSVCVCVCVCLCVCERECVCV